MYTELHVNFLGLRVPKAGFLIVKDPNQVLDKKKLDEINGHNWLNLVWLAYLAFVQKHGVSVFDSFECPKEVNSLPFCQLHLFYADVYIESMVWSVYHQVTYESLVKLMLLLYDSNRTVIFALYLYIYILI